MQNDLQGSETCLQVEADGVTIDGNGHTITGSGSSDSYGIEVGVVDHPYSTDIEPWNVHVHDVTLEGWDNGLTARSVERLTVEEVTAENSASDGIRVRDGVGIEISEAKVTNNGGDGISFGDVHDSTVEYVTASMNDDSGISFFMPSGDNPGYNTNVTVAHNVVTDNGQDFNGDGIRVTGDEIVVVNNTATGNNGNGIVDDRSSVDNTYTHNNVLDNYGHGILVDYTTEGTVVEYTNATGNAGSGIKVDPYAANVTVVHNHLEGNNHGVYVASGTDNWFENNTAVANSATGFRAENGASRNTFVDNRAIDNEQHGILIEGSSNDARLIDNTIRGSGDRGVDVRGSDGVTLSGDTIFDSGNWDIRAGDYLDSSSTGAEVDNVTASDVTVGHAYAEMTIDFVATDVAFGSIVRPSVPEELTAVGTVLNVESHPTDGSLEITFHYDVGDVDDPDTLGIWSHDGAEWSEIGGEIDPDARTATATTTEDGKIGLFGERDAEVPETGALEGVVTGDSSPISDADVEVIEQVDVGDPDPAPDGFTATLSTDEDGVFEVDVPPGVYKITVETLGYDDGLYQNVEVEAGEHEAIGEIELDTVPVLTGTVTDSETNDPVEGVEIQSHFFPSEPKFSATTDADGAYAINVPEHHSQTPSVRFTADGFYPEVLTADDALLDDPTGGDVALTPESPTGTVVGQVTEQSTGDPVQGAFVSVSSDPGVEFTDEDGWYELEVETGTHTIEVTTEHVPPMTGTSDVEVTEGETTTANVEVAPDTRSPELAVQEASVTPLELETGDVVTVTASVENVGNEDGELIVPLEVDGEVIDTETVELDVEKTTPVAFTHAFDTSGEYEVSVGGVDAGTVTVNAGPNLVVYGANVDEAAVELGEEAVVVSASLINTGDVPGTETIELRVRESGTGADLRTVESESFDVTPGEIDPLELSWDPDADDEFDLGENLSVEFDVYLGDLLVDTVAVEDRNSDIQVIAASTSETELIGGEEEAYVIGSIYQAGTIEGTEEIELTATHEDGTETMVGSQEVTLSPGYYHLGALNVTFAPEQAGNYTLELGERNAGSVEVEPRESDVQVIAASASATEVIEGESFHVVGSIYQAGNVDDPQDVELTATHEDTGAVVDLGVSEGISLAPGYYHLGAINLTGEIDLDESVGIEAGNYTLHLGERNAGTIHVEPRESDVQVIAASASATEIVEGESFHVVGSIYQAGNVDDPQDVVLNATLVEDAAGEPVTDGETLELGVSEDVSLAPGYYHLGAINLTAQFDEPGRYDLTLGDRSAGQIDVEPRESDVQVVAASLSEMNVSVNEEFYVVGSIYQAGNVDDPQDVALNATPTDGGEPIELDVSEDVSLAPGYYHLGAINLTGTLDETGTYDITLGEHDVGTIGVEESPSDIQVIAASLSEIEVLEDEELYVVGSIYQNGTANGGDSLSEDIELWATNETGDERHLGVQEDVELKPGYYHLGAVNISFAIDEPGTYDLTLGGHDAGQLEVLETNSDVQVIAASASATEVLEGESFHVVGSIYQAGNVAEPEDIALTATHEDGGGPIELGVSEDVSLAPGYYHLGAINLTGALDEPGNYTLELGERNAGTIHVEPAVSDVQVIAASASATEVIEGESFHVVGSIYQAGNVDEPEDIALTATHEDGGDPIELGVSEDVSLAPGYYHLGAINLTGTLDEPGNYTLELGDRPAGTVEALPAESDVQVIAASADANEVAAGESFNVIGSIYQAGTVDDPENVALNATLVEDAAGESVTDGETLELGVQEDVSLSPGFYHLGALNVSAAFEADELGTYELELGERPAGTIKVREPIVEPSIVDVDGHSSAIDPDFDERTVTYASDDVAVELKAESDFPLESVFVHVSSLESNYQVEVEAESAADGTLAAEIPIEGPDAIADDGAYELSAIAVDEHGYFGLTAETELLVIDREEPTMSVSIEDVTADDATVVVESDVPLSGVPTIELDFDDSSTQSSDPSVELTDHDPTNTTFEGTLTFDKSGEYTVTVTGTDRAGKEDTDETSVVVNTDLVLSNGQLAFEGANSNVTFDVDGVHEDLSDEELFLAVSESTVNANLDDGAVGVGFLQTELPGLLEAHLEGAEIKLTVSGADLPDGVGTDDLALHHYDGGGEWTPVEDAEITQVGNDISVVSAVPGFSTYGVLVTDTEPPELGSVTPADGETVSTASETIEVVFEYDDAISGVNASAVAMDVNGADVTDDDATNIHSTKATHDLEIEYDEEYTVTVTVVDEAGEEATFETTFTVVESTDSDDSGGSGGFPGIPPSDPADDDADESEPDDGDDRDGTDDESASDTADDADGAGTGVDDTGGSPDDAAGYDDTVPGFGVIIAIVAILLATAIGLRRR
ncbi:PGF-CTERM sorting domain-containing protein [Natronorubrum sp. JWXQ-INN-674]|uniref:PGF-CTERM sorting domain-containing protein n=1 Tax=Natronorubrum halalkaliphilum TaxID=2691917 RepID=A0A6B0VLM4_9EURY|nr:right-handed parallel beta-helix repeat-containing protein [Natronorubrum halalkaliphilum]MXV61906.1 PGF-CTERM sorting domain-containing protein [Natronorubrum halalkaliphilum]